MRREEIGWTYTDGTHIRCRKPLESHNSVSLNPITPPYGTMDCDFERELCLSAAAAAAALSSLMYMATFSYHDEEQDFKKATTFGREQVLSCMYASSILFYIMYCVCHWNSDPVIQYFASVDELEASQVRAATKYGTDVVVHCSGCKLCLSAAAAAAVLRSLMDMTTFLYHDEEQDFKPLQPVTSHVDLWSVLSSGECELRLSAAAAAALHAAAVSCSTQHHPRQRRAPCIQLLEEGTE
eukprot:SM000025S08480  [mRNA]  locus=s25:1065517:1069653:- [translate_table: standard]